MTQEVIQFASAGITQLQRRTCCKKTVDYISGRLVVPRNLFMEVGGFDLAYEPAYYEDTISA